MATANSTATNEGFFEYNELPWGDLIYGTKELLQKIGIGAGMAFPGEDAGPKKKFTTTDPRGFSCTVSDAGYRGRGIFSARIEFPGRERVFGVSDWNYFAPGVQRKAFFWTDDFVGSADDLVSAGLVPAGYFPGLPGMRKSVVTILPNGCLPQGAPTASLSCNERGPGTKSIKRVSTKKFCVEITIPLELADQRREAAAHADAEWESRMRALPRPPRIDVSMASAKDEMVRERRAAIHLVRPEQHHHNKAEGNYSDDNPNSLPNVHHHYHYPKSMLRQAYFCRNSYGDWMKPSLSLAMLSNPKFVSPIGLLLDQLEDEGHDVSGARIEWRAFRELSGTLSERVRGAFGQFLGISDTSPPLASALYDKPL
jgi:hypothetical protein